MLLAQIKDLLERVRGCTFASIDSETHPAVGIKKVTTGESVLIFNSNVSGYENMVKRRLAALGKNPDDFVVGDLPWGQRMDGMPGCLIVHKDVYHLQTIILKPGETEVFVGDKKVPADEVQYLLPTKRGNNQGLPDDNSVVVRTYKLDSIVSIRLMGEEIGQHCPNPPEPSRERERKPILRVPGLRRD